MMVCCGENVQTAFCPNCGKKNPAQSPLHDLLNHVRIQCGARQREIERTEHLQRREKDHAHRRYWERRVEAKKEQHGKWKRWLEALEGVVGKKNET